MNQIVAVEQAKFQLAQLRQKMLKEGVLTSTPQAKAEKEVQLALGMITGIICEDFGYWWNALHDKVQPEIIQKIVILRDDYCGTNAEEIERRVLTFCNQFHSKQLH